MTVRAERQAPPNPWARTSRTHVDAPSGYAVRFHGCTSQCCPHPDLFVAGAAGTITADTDSWGLTNESDSIPLLVWSLDDPGEQTRVLPGRSTSPPFDLAGVSGADGHILTVFGPETARSRRSWCVGELPIAWGLHPDSRSHSVMLALVSSRMHGGSSTPPPTARAIGKQLGISHRTVQEHLRNLVDELGIPVPANRPRGWIQAALVSYALQHPYIAAPG